MAPRLFRKSSHFRFCFLCSVVLFAVASLDVATAQANPFRTSLEQERSLNSIPDPNQGPSELNHHLLGYALLGAGIVLLSSQVSARFRSLRFVWPILLILGGLFLAAWSDSEIWPRGNLNWFWLLHHDREAGQHKVFAILLLILGGVECLRIRGKLPRAWRVWSFPLLALVGSSILLMHDHAGSSGTQSDEIRAYLINPALDPDGKVPRNKPASPLLHAAHHPDATHDHKSVATIERGSAENAATLTDVEREPSHEGHSIHQMSQAIIRIEQQHLWFVVVGCTIAIFKFLADSRFWKHWSVPYIWQAGISVLGILLVIYRE